MEMMLDKKHTLMILLLELNMGHKAVETTCNINYALGLETVNKHKVQWWFKRFCKGNESLENEKHSAQPWEVDNDQLRVSSKLILLQPPEKLLKDSALTILWMFGIWSIFGKV